MNVLQDWFSSGSSAPGGTFRVMRWIKGEDVSLDSAHAKEKEKPVRQHDNRANRVRSKRQLCAYVDWSSCILARRFKGFTRISLFKKLVIVGKVIIT
jgi:hypothetical protein